MAIKYSLVLMVLCSMLQSSVAQVTEQQITAEQSVTQEQPLLLGEQSFKSKRTFAQLCLLAAQKVGVGIAGFICGVGGCKMTYDSVRCLSQRDIRGIIGINTGFFLLCSAYMAGLHILQR